MSLLLLAGLQLIPGDLYEAGVDRWCSRNPKILLPAKLLFWDGSTLWVCANRIDAFFGRTPGRF
jgi:hypothetical protein